MISATGTCGADVSLGARLRSYEVCFNVLEVLIGDGALGAAFGGHAFAGRRKRSVTLSQSMWTFGPGKVPT